jgi:phosphoglycerate dehydrogenase-like enzyme
LAKRLRAFDMRVIGFSYSDGRHDPTFDVPLNRVDLLATAPQLDFLVVLVPFSPATKHIVNAGVLGAMKPSAFVINLARGGVLDESALALCLHEGCIAGAALDVFAHEPLPPDSELWDCPNLLITPHVGANCDDYAERASPIVVENVRRFLDGADARSLLNYVRG